MPLIKASCALCKQHHGVVTCHSVLDICRTFPDNIQFRHSAQTRFEPEPEIKEGGGGGGGEGETESKVQTQSWALAQEQSLANLPEILQKLRRVLVCFSLYRPEIGYCQGMNFIAGLALLFMPEEHVFWLLVTIVDDLMPLDIYSKELMGTSIDQDIFKLLLKIKFPKISKATEDMGVPLSLITCEWFLALFVNALPIEVSCSVMKCNTI